MQWQKRQKSVGNNMQKVHVEKWKNLGMVHTHQSWEVRYLIRAVMGWAKKKEWLSPISPQNYGESLPSRKGEVSKIHIHPQEAWYRILKLPNESQSYG